MSEESKTVPDAAQPAPKPAADGGQVLFTRCWQGVHASTAGVRPAQLWRSMDAHDRSLWAYAVFETGLLEKVIAAHRADIARLEDERDAALRAVDDLQGELADARAELKWRKAAGPGDS